ncbi:TPA: ABC transporter permease [Citrobacter braakii]|uniref:ABC transporter permease n=1 Tax=unclassified Citrobacter TaxID=2644389 RepID=UPI0015E971D3|nr:MULTISPECIES: ABC transporter permease [unclassified Citrobacter]HCB1682054.1 ABC transporter permease [Citrobacter braakii]MDM3313590.1 ABC transporter permease [Citrobacter sp. Cb220]QLR47355.1 ABC transporter permease [Citrobacter sp. RHBSTW-00986]HEM7929034.1 ABC transporter permease [Citrobacter braakii]HEM7955798.1 ABC transporter permease [Citrobacter braakii]
MFNSFFNDLVKYKTVLGQLVKQQVTLRYRRTIFGFLWTLLNPLLNMIVIATVFSIVLKFQIRDYSIFLFSAIIPWTMFSNTIAQCSQSLIMNESLIKKIYLPKQLFITANAFSVLIDSFLSTICLFIIALMFGAKLSFALLFLPFSFFILFFFTFGLGLILSICSVFLRDMQYLIGVLLQALYFITPIIYPISAVPEEFRWVFSWNPMFYFVELFRDPIYNNVLPSFDLIKTCIIFSGVAFVMGVYIFKSNEHKIVFRL